MIITGNGADHCYLSRKRDQAPCHPDRVDRFRPTTSFDGLIRHPKLRLYVMRAQCRLMAVDVCSWSIAPFSGDVQTNCQLVGAPSVAPFSLAWQCETKCELTTPKESPGSPGTTGLSTIVLSCRHPRSTWHRSRNSMHPSRARP
jgi:hypothetical protein